jgi:hypothetical protein
MKKRSSTAKALLLGVLFSAGGPQDKDTISKVILKTFLFLLKALKTKISSGSNDGKCRSCHQLRLRPNRGGKD